MPFVECVNTKSLYFYVFTSCNWQTMKAFFYESCMQTRVIVEVSYSYKIVCLSALILVVTLESACT